jgi:predicted metal-dependent phosphoesterase TrpH
MYTDLHLHTTFSDGTYSPEELTGEAARHGFVALALTDHDTVEGCARMKVACDAAGIEFIPATELTAEMDGIELHLIGYFIDTKNPKLLGEIQRFQEVRQERIREIVERLNQMNLPLKEQDVLAIANCKSPGRPHVARALIQAKLCTSLDEAFERYLKKGKPAWVPKCKISAVQAINMIHAAGGLAVLAHPGLARSNEAIEPLIEIGLDGLECFHTKHPPALSEHYVGFAEERGLLITGGSDCHGMNKGKPLIGSIKLPYQYVLELKQRLPKGHPARDVRPANFYRD